MTLGCGSTARKTSSYYRKSPVYQPASHPNPRANWLTDARLPRGSPEHCAGSASDSPHGVVRLPLLYSRTSRHFSALLFHLTLTPQETPEGGGAWAPHLPSFREAGAAEYLLLGHLPFPAAHHLLFALEPDSEAGKPESASWGHTPGPLPPVISLPHFPIPKKQFPQSIQMPGHFTPTKELSHLDLPPNPSGDIISTSSTTPPRDCQDVWTGNAAQPPDVFTTQNLLSWANTPLLAKR